jgi:hypothetical protein
MRLGSESPSERAGKLLRSLLWRRLDVPALEHFRLWENPDGPRLEGTIVAALEGAPLEVRYTVACSPTWETRRARVELETENEARALELDADEAQAWSLNGRRINELTGCRDVDLGITPSTNILPIRRLALEIGEGREVTAAWVRFPDLAVTTLPQRYTRLAERCYRYESRGGSFTAELEVDDLGLVERYGDFWERVG